MADKHKVIEDLPLVVDLDGTLILSDLLYESTLKYVVAKPQNLLALPGHLLAGKAKLKRHIANQVTIDVTKLPYNLPFLEWLHTQKRNGRHLVLCTASDQSLADAVAKHLGIFDDVLGSDGANNLAGKNKALALKKFFGNNNYAYAGNAKSDLPVWEKCSAAIVVNAEKGIETQLTNNGKVEAIFPRSKVGIEGPISMLRVHQWLKNILLFLPFIASHDLENIQSWITLVVAFFSFSFCASVVYITNDLIDLDSDRSHPRKKARVFASGKISILSGVLLIPLLVAMSLFLAFHVSATFLNFLILYFVWTCAYSIYLKRIPVFDCVTLAILYTLRVVAGAAAIGNVLSFWLAAFSVFIFLSLAFVKRYSEIHDLLLSKNKDLEQLVGRDYTSKDAPLILTMGIAAGYSATIVMALYLNSYEVTLLYQNIWAVWSAILVLVFWISWMWFKANRGQMHDDPIIFALRDKTSLVAGVSFIALMLLGSRGLPW